MCLLLVASLACAEEITVKGDKGAIKGVRIDHDFGQYFYAFRGIRYAKAPVGKLRFKVRRQIFTIFDPYFFAVSLLHGKKIFL